MPEEPEVWANQDSTHLTTFPADLPELRRLFNQLRERRLNSRLKSRRDPGDKVLERLFAMEKYESRLEVLNKLYKHPA